jgi:fatty-acyl-CoA synthase
MAIPTYDWIAHYASTRGDSVAMEDLATGRSFTYAEFHRRVDRLAAGLRARFGVARGDRVAVLAHNSSDLFELQFACTRIGAIFAPMNWRLTTSELRFIVGDCEPVVMFYDVEFGDAALELSAACGVPHLCGRDLADSAYERLIAEAVDDVTSEPLTHDDIATILYTSGTTGHPKGAIITHGMRFWQTINLTGPARITADSTALVVLPQFHVGGLDVFANPVFHYGGRAVVMRAYDPALTLRLFTDRDANITHFIGAPAHFQFMAQLPQFAYGCCNPHLLAYVAAAPVPLPLLHQWRERGLTLIQAYGMTETCGVITIMEPSDALPKAGSAGKSCLHFAVRLVGADGTDAPAGQIGEIWVKGPSTTPGYWKRPEATASTFTDGWLRTGDAALTDEDGFYYIVDRWKDMYITGGENVYPAEVEDVLYQLSAIAEVAIIGVADERWGEVGRAIIALKAGHPLTEAEIMLHCEANLAHYKHPRSIRFVEALPRNATGKVHKPTLRQQFGAA